MDAYKLQQQIGHTLHQGFDWYDSKEGYDFWRMMHENLGDHWIEDREPLHLPWRFKDDDATRKTLGAVITMLNELYLKLPPNRLEKLIYEYISLRYMELLDEV